MGRSVSYPSGALVAFTHFDEEMDCWDWQDVINDTRDYACELWPSFEPADYWRGREDLVLARNRLVEFGMSEYCGLVAYWLVARDDLDAGRQALAEAWIARVGGRFIKTFGPLRLVGRFSNGEAIYERIAA